MPQRIITLGHQQRIDFWKPVSGVIALVLGAAGSGVLEQVRVVVVVAVVVDVAAVEDAVADFLTGLLARALDLGADVVDIALEDADPRQALLQHFYGAPHAAVAALARPTLARHLLLHNLPHQPAALMAVRLRLRLRRRLLLHLRLPHPTLLALVVIVVVVVILLSAPNLPRSLRPSAARPPLPLPMSLRHRSRHGALRLLLGPLLARRDAPDPNPPQIYAPRALPLHRPALDAAALVVVRRLAHPQHPAAVVAPLALDPHAAARLAALAVLAHPRLWRQLVRVLRLPVAHAGELDPGAVFGGCVDREGVAVLRGVRLGEGVEGGEGGVGGRRGGRHVEVCGERVGRRRGSGSGAVEGWVDVWVGCGPGGGTDGSVGVVVMVVVVVVVGLVVGLLLARYGGIGGECCIGLHLRRPMAAAGDAGANRGIADGGTGHR